jgi:chromosome segregation ATPase
MRCLEDNSNTRLKSDVTGLLNTVAERDRYIRQLTDRLSELQGKNQELEAQITAVKAEREELASEQMAFTASDSFTLSQSWREIEMMQAALSQGLNAKQVSSLVTAEMEELRMKRDLTNKKLTELTAELARTLSEVSRLKLDNANLWEQITQEINAANRARNDLETIRQRVDVSFTAAQLAGYMSQAIESFNREANVGDLSVNYIINDMGVTFKVNLMKNDTGEMTLAAPPLSEGNESLSTIKFNISAIPKEGQS